MPGQEIGDKEGDCTHRLQERERPAADPSGDQLGKVGIYRDEFETDAERADEPPEVDTVGGGLHAHDQIGDAEPDQRVGKYGAAAEVIGDVRHEQRGDEQSGEQRRDEAGEPGHAEKADGCGSEDLGLEQARAQSADEANGVAVEKPAEREQYCHDPQASSHGEAVEPRGEPFRGGNGPRRKSSSTTLAGGTCAASPEVGRLAILTFPLLGLDLVSPGNRAKPGLKFCTAT